MNENEKRCYDLLTRNGYHVLRKGWPDFMVTDSNFQGGFAVELKVGHDRLSADQKAMHAILGRLGVAVHVWREQELGKLRALRGRAFLLPEDVRRARQRLEEIQRQVESLRVTLDSSTYMLEDSETVARNNEALAALAALPDLSPRCSAPTNSPP